MKAGSHESGSKAIFSCHFVNRNRLARVRLAAPLTHVKVAAWLPNSLQACHSTGPIPNVWAAMPTRRFQLFHEVLNPSQAWIIQSPSL